MAEAFRWYLATVAIGGAGLLPAAVLFPTLRSRGVLYARPLALVLISVAAWWIGWSGVVPYGLGALGLVLTGLWIRDGRDGGSASGPRDVGGEALAVDRRRRARVHHRVRADRGRARTGAERGGDREADGPADADRRPSRRCAAAA